MKTNYLLIAILLLGVNNAFSQQNPDIFPDLEGWERNEVRIWGPDNLYVPINGAADMFLSYHFEEMRALDYMKDDLYITVEVYRHKTTVDAFGAYSQERSKDGSLYLDIGNEGYSEEGYLNFLQGRYYIKIRSGTPGEESQAAIIKLAEGFADKLSGKNEHQRIFSCFPAENQVPYSGMYINENVFGYSFLNSSYEHKYEEGEMRYTLCILKGDDQDDAKAMLTKYHETLSLDFTENPDQFYVIDDIYTGTVKVQLYDRYLICALGDISVEDSKEKLHGVKEGLSELAEE